MGLPKFMASTAGRAVRVIAGIALIGVGALLGGGWWAWQSSAWSRWRPAFSMSAWPTRCSASP